MSKLAQFNVSTQTYKIVNTHEILADIWIPKSARAGSCPLIIRFHGGGLFTGSRNFEPWTAKWLVDYATQQSAIILSGDYRLMPEATGTEIMEDIEDVFKWAHEKLPELVLEMTDGKVNVDLERIITIGDSAGGYLAIQLGISHAKLPNGVRSVIAQYPMIGLRQPFFSSPHSEPDSAFRPDSSIQSPSYIEEYLSKTPSPSAISNAVPPERDDFVQTAIYHGQVLKLLLRGTDDTTALKLNPEDRVKAGEKVPPIFILHGTDDIIVPVEMSTNFVDILLKAGHPEDEIFLATRSGGHGFDETTALSYGWLQEGLKFVEKFWLQQI